MRRPLIALEITSCWICSVPSNQPAVLVTGLLGTWCTLALRPRQVAVTQVEAGAAAAPAMLEDRDGDDRNVPFPLTVGTEPASQRSTQRNWRRFRIGG